MGANRFFLFDSGELYPWEVRGAAPRGWPDITYFREMLVAVDSMVPDAGLRFVLTLAVRETIPITGEDVIVVCLADELARTPSYAHDVRLVAKTYGDRRPPHILQAARRTPGALAATVLQEAVVQLRRAPSLARSRIRTLQRRHRPTIITLPLGTWHLEDVPFIPFDERPIDVSFAGSRVNEAAQAQRMIRPQKLRTRSELEHILEQLRASRPDLRIEVNVIEDFHDAPKHASRYSHLLMESRLVVSPRGASLETFRYFEAVRSGAIPITEHLPPHPFYTGGPSVPVGRWSQLPLIVDRLLGDPAALRSRHEAVLRWWQQRCSPQAAAITVVRSIDPARIAESGPNCPYD